MMLRKLRYVQHDIRHNGDDYTDDFEGAKRKAAETLHHFR